MKTWTNKTFTGHWPGKSAAVVVATNQHEAAELLNKVLHKIGLPGDAEAEDMLEFPASSGEEVRVLCDGQY